MSSILSQYLGGGVVKYSTDEQVVGIWIDGKPLYQKTYVLDNPTTGDLFETTNITVIDIFGYYVYDQNGNTMPIPYSRAENNEIMFWSEGISKRMLHLQVSSTSYKIVFTMLYTKTTD